MSVNIAVRWADDTKQLAANLREGTDAITATKASVDKLVQSLGGDKLLTAAHRMVAAIGELGGAEKLTNNERDRTNALLDKAIQKYAALGQEAPSAMRALFDETKRVTTATSAMVDGMTAASKQSAASISIIGGMSQAGRDAATVLNKEVVPATTNWGGALKNVSGLLGGFGVSLSVGSAVGFVKSVMADADALVRLSDQTGVSTDWLQRFQVVADDTGDTVEGLAAAASKLQKNLGAKDPAAIAALEELGLSYEHIRSLSPEDQFLEVAEALRKVDDQNRQVALGTTLMGRGFVDSLASVKAGFDQVKDAAPAMSEATVKAIDAVGDAWARMWREAKGQGAEFLVWLKTTFPATVDDTAKGLEKELADMFARAAKGVKFPVSPGVAPPELPKDMLKDQEALTALFGDQQKNYDRTEAAAEAYRVKLAALNEKIREATRDIGHLSDAQKEEAIRLDQLNLSAEDIGFLIKASGEAVKRFLDVNNDLEKALERITTHVSTKAIPAFTGLILTWEQMKNTGKGLTVDGLIPMAKGFDDLARAELALKLYSDDLTKSHVALQNQLARTIGLMPDLSAAAKEHFLEAGGAVAEIPNVFAEAFKDLPTIMQHAFEGGGGLEGAAKSLGTKLANDVIASYAARMKAAGTPLTTAQTAALGAGTAGGAAVGGAFGGPTGAMIGSTAASIGGAALIAGGAFGGAAAGVGGAIALGATTAGIGAAAVGVYLLAKHFLTVSQNEKDARAEFAKLQDLYGSLPATIDAVSKAYAFMGYSGTDAEAAVKRALDATHESAAQEDAALRPILAILASTEQYTTDIKTGVDGLTQAGAAFGGHVPDQFKAAVTQLAAMKGVTDEERTALLAMTADVKPDFEALTQTAAKYGVTLEGLGTSFQQANIEGRAKDIAGDFEALVKAGGDAGGILAGMSDEISALVNDSKRFGTAIPENMRPLIDELLRAGKLTDENGDKLTDVSNITFEATPIDDSMTKLADAIEKLRLSLEGLAKLQIPPVQVPVTYVATNAPPAGVAAPALPAPGFASGTGGFRDFGTGTLAVLHGREAVITEAQALRSDYSVTSATSAPAAVGDVHVTFAISTLDATDFQTVVEQKVFPALVNQLRRGRGLTAMKDVLG